MNGFEQRVNDFILREVKISPDKGVVIAALSGGADSVAMLSALVSLGFDCVAAHCNFHLRGEESDRDMNHSKMIADKLGVKFEVIDFDVPGRMAATGESMEMACRELRYEWFAKLKERYGAQAVATGHHLEDNVETMLLNLIRGAGITGASGIAPRSERRVSPLLEMSKQEILDYLIDKGLTYITDSSNLSSDITRNKLRHGALAMLAHDFPGAMEGISRSLSHLREDASVLEQNVSGWKEEYINGDTILLDKIRKNDDGGYILFQLLKPLKFNREQCENMLLASSGNKFVADGNEIVINRGFGILQPVDRIQPAAIPLISLFDSNPYFTAEEIDLKDFNPERNNNVIYLDPDKFPANCRWELRQPQKGDRMEPFGMKGRSKLISDIFNDTKTDSRRKESSLVLTCNDMIIWLLGIKASNHFKIDDNSKKVIKLLFTNCG